MNALERTLTSDLKSYNYMTMWRVCTAKDNFCATV